MFLFSMSIKGSAAKVTVYASTDCTGASETEDMMLGGCLSDDYYNSKTTSNGVT
jgi:hypothetical protein